MSKNLLKRIGLLLIISAIWIAYIWAAYQVADAIITIRLAVWIGGGGGSFFLGYLVAYKMED